MGLNAEDVQDIVLLLEQSSFDELVLETDKLKLTLRRGGPVVADAPRPPPVAAPVASPSTPEASPSEAPRITARSTEPGVIDVPSPLLGVFYRAPKPGEPPFVEVGQTVGPETVIGIIEVMKLMNSARAGVAGEIVEIPAENGALVEYGEPLIRVRKS